MRFKNGCLPRYLSSRSSESILNLASSQADTEPTESPRQFVYCTMPCISSVENAGFSPVSSNQTAWVPPVHTQAHLHCPSLQQQPEHWQPFSRPVTFLATRRISCVPPFVVVNTRSRLIFSTQSLPIQPCALYPTATSNHHRIHFPSIALSILCDNVLRRHLSRLVGRPFPSTTWYVYHCPLQALPSSDAPSL